MLLLFILVNVSLTVAASVHVQTEFSESIVKDFKRGFKLFLMLQCASGSYLVPVWFMEDSYMLCRVKVC
jgi:hypothetical protein